MAASDAPSPVRGLESAFVGLYQKNADTVVRVKVATTSSNGNSRDKVSLTVFSGFFVSKDGLIVTNAIPQKDVTRIWIEHQGKSYVAESVGSDERSNVGLLKLVAPPDALHFVDLNEPDPHPPIGSFAFSITSPLDFAPSPAWGLLTGRESGFGELNFPFTYTRVSIPIGPAEGGSPVFDLDGRLIGVSVATLPEVNSGYTVPTRALRKIVEDLRSEGRVRHVDLHVQFEERPATPEGARRIVIKSIEPGSQADQQKMRVGDTLVKIDDLQIDSIDQARDLIFFSEPGSFVQLTVKRGDQQLDFALLLDTEKSGGPKP